MPVYLKLCDYDTGIKLCKINIDTDLNAYKNGKFIQQLQKLYSQGLLRNTTIFNYRVAAQKLPVNQQKLKILYKHYLSVIYL